MPTKSFKSFAEFCPFYLAEHNKPTTLKYPRLSFMGDRPMQVSWRPPPAFHSSGQPHAAPAFNTWPITLHP